MLARSREYRNQRQLTVETSLFYGKPRKLTSARRHPRRPASSRCSVSSTFRRAIPLKATAHHIASKNSFSESKRRVEDACARACSQNLHSLWLLEWLQHRPGPQARPHQEHKPARQQAPRPQPAAIPALLRGHLLSRPERPA